MTVTVTVEQRHIDAGRPDQSRLCPVALALQDQCQGVWAVGWGSAYRLAPGCAPYRLPAKARDFILAFDNGESVSPFAFEMEEI